MLQASTTVLGLVVDPGAADRFDLPVEMDLSVPAAPTRLPTTGGWAPHTQIMTPPARILAAPFRNALGASFRASMKVSMFGLGLSFLRNSARHRGQWRRRQSNA